MEGIIHLPQGRRKEKEKEKKGRWLCLQAVEQWGVSRQQMTNDRKGGATTTTTTTTQSPLLITRWAAMATGQGTSSSSSTVLLRSSLGNFLTYRIFTWVGALFDFGCRLVVIGKCGICRGHSP